MQTLERDHTTVQHQRSLQQSHPKQNIHSPRPNATQRTGRIQEREILRRTHIHPTTDCRTMPGMEDTVLCKLWCILRHYGIPCKIVNTINMLYEGFKTNVTCCQHLTE